MSAQTARVLNERTSEDRADAVAPSAPLLQTDIAGPTGSGTFGDSVTVLPNGNIVVTDPTFSIPAGATNVGAVYLYDGGDLHLISTLRGTTAGDQVGIGGITVLANGNYVISSRFWDNPSLAAGNNAGAVTWASATAGVSGTGSSSNSLVSGSAGGASGDLGSSSITALTNGNYVVPTATWDNPSLPANNDAGAATWGSGTAGVSGLISVSNSLVGGSVGDNVGGNITALPNGNYVVQSTNWDNPSGPVADVGAVTWGNGASGVRGVVSVTNSLIGGSANDQVGFVTVLTNGNYVVRSTAWDNPAGSRVDAGSVTWANGTTGIVGPVGPSNSLVGTSAGDQVGTNGVTLLTNGNYVVSTASWDDPSGPVNVGAVTWGDGTQGVSGTISAANSIVGGTAGDNIGNIGATPLTNGNYVVPSSNWHNPSGPAGSLGAVTWGNGATGTTGVVTAANSLVGGTNSDLVGSSAVIPLTNGNYVVLSPNWDDPSGPIVNVGAATWGNGASGVTGLVTTSNSLTGGRANDSVGLSGTPLLNGNYVVRSVSWDNPSGNITDAGAATFGSGAAGITGLVTSTNSLVGGSLSDGVGSQVIALTNGNYVVSTPNWDNPSLPAGNNVGASTWAIGTAGKTGLVTSSNSLVGGTTNDQIGGNGTTALKNGNYVLNSRSWDNPSVASNAGAVTWGDGTVGLIGLVTPSNSLIGGSANDVIGDSTEAFSNGNFVFGSFNWDRPSGPVIDARAYTFGNGANGGAGVITDGAAGGNSVFGTVAGGVNTYAFDPTRNRVIVGRASSNRVSLLSFSTTAIADGNIDNPAIWSNGLPNGLVNAVIPAGRTIALNGISRIGLVSVACGGSLTGGSASNHVVGSIRKDYCAATSDSFTYALGDGVNYTPMAASSVAGTGALTVAVTDDWLTGLQKATSASRLWSLTGSGITANLSFTYADSDVNGPESNFKVAKRTVGRTSVVPSTVNAATNTATVSGVSSFSEWGVGNYDPVAVTAAGVNIAGRVTSVGGRGVTGASVSIMDVEGHVRRIITGRLGLFSFEGLEAGRSYLVSVTARRYRYAPQQVLLMDSVMDLNFIPERAEPSSR